MSIRMMTKVWDFAPYRGEKLLTLLALADWSNDDGECWPSYDQIAQKARMTERGAIGIIGKLIEDQAITVTSPGRGRGVRNKYKLLPTNWKEKQERVNELHPLAVPERVNELHPLAVPERVNELHPSSPLKGERESRKRVNVEAEKGERDCIAYKEVTVSKPSEEKPSAAAAEPAAAAEFDFSLIPISAFSIEIIKAYVLATKPHAKNPGGLAIHLCKSGEDDEDIAVWLEPQESREAERDAAILRIKTMVKTTEDWELDDSDQQFVLANRAATPAFRELAARIDEHRRQHFAELTKQNSLPDYLQMEDTRCTAQNTNA